MDGVPPRRPPARSAQDVPSSRQAPLRGTAAQHTTAPATAPAAADARSAWDDLVGQVAQLPPPVPPPPRPLRHRQQEAVLAFYRSKARGVKRQLIVLPTGGGKTILARDLISRHQRSVFHVPRRELLRQTADVMSQLFGHEAVGIISDTAHDIQAHHRVVVAMVPTCVERISYPAGHPRHIPPDGFDLVIFDECHHAPARTWRALAEYYVSGTRLGLTGTPERSDGAPMNDVFDEITYELSITDAITEGLLVPPLAKVVQTSVDISAVRRKGAELDPTELSRAIDTPARNDLIVRSYQELGENRRFIAFCASVDHAQHLAQTFTAAGIPTAAVWGKDPERDQKLADHASGILTGLANVHTLTEGYDDPQVSCVIMARPMGSRNTYTQALGRGLRLYPGKSNCLVIDVVDNAGRHNLAAAWKFFGELGGSVEEKRRRTARTPEASHLLYEALGGTLPLRSFVKQVSLLQLPPEVRPQPYGTHLWQREPASAAQLTALERAGYDVTQTSWTAGQARIIIEAFPPTAKQAILLVAYGFDVFTQPWTRLQADAALGSAKAAGKPNWQKLAQLVPDYKSVMQRDPEWH